MHLSELNKELDRLCGKSLLREPDDSLTRSSLVQEFGPLFLDACSNDYLGLAMAPPDPMLASESTSVSRETAVPVSLTPTPLGAGASRLVFGSHAAHVQLEQEVAAWLGRESALLFSSGYAANLGALSAVLSPGDAVFSDSLNHASLIDGIRLSGAKAQVVPHGDLVALEQGLKKSASAPARWVVVESYYSMDGDGPDLGKVRALCDRYDAHLYVDEAHSIGTFGPEGRGLCAAAGVVPDLMMLAFGKALGAHGACVVSSVAVRTWLWNRARAFVYSTAPSPVLVEIMRSQVERVRAAEQLRSQLAEHSAALRSQLRSAGVPIPADSFGPILSLVLGSAERALGCAQTLRAQGILAQAIRPPTVSEGTSRLRLVLHAGMSEEQRDRLAQALIEALRS